MIFVRRATSDDAERVHDLLERAEKSGSLPMERFRQVYLEHLAEANLACVIVAIDTNIAAFGSVRFDMPLHCCKPVASVQEFVLDERRRGKGVAARLVGAMMLLARDKGCISLEVDSPRASKWSHRFFEKQGFVFTRYGLAMNIGFAAEADGMLPLANQE